MNILIINIGSTSIKLNIVEFSTDANQETHYKIVVGKKVGLDSNADQLLTDIQQLNFSIDCIAHRIVHGGDYFQSSCMLNEENIKQLEKLSDLAPLHNPKAIQWIKSCQKKFDLPQIGVFDTAFYTDMPKVAKRYAIPKKWVKKYGIKRYGFHGIAHYSMWQRWCELRPDLKAGGKLITIQLGGGCSITAIQNGRPMDTSMGFSPNEGLMMTTRCGDINPGALFHLMREKNISVDEMSEALNKKSGLLGVSNKSSDIGDLITDSCASAQLAVDLFCYRVQKTLGAYIAVLGGVDGICLGGGISAYQPIIREKIIDSMKWYKVELDKNKNKGAIAKEEKISTETSSVDVRVMQVEESQHIAEEAFKLITQN